MSKMLRSKSKGKAKAKEGENPQNWVNNPGCSTDLGRRAAEKHGPGLNLNCGYICNSASTNIVSLVVKIDVLLLT